MFYVAHRLFAAHDRVLGALIAQELGSAVGMNEVFLPFCDTDEENLVAEVKGRRLFELDCERLACLDGMLAVLHGPSLDDGVCMEIGYAAASGVPIVVLTTDFQIYGASEHGATLHFPDALVETVVTEIVRIDRSAVLVDAGSRFEAFRDRNSGQLTTAVRLAVDRLVHHARSPSEREPAAPEDGTLAVCERSPYYTSADWARIVRLLRNRDYRVYEAERCGVANPLAAARRDWRELLNAGLLVVDTSGPETPCGAAVIIGGATALARRIIAWHPTPSWTFAHGREPNWRNLMIQYSIDARVSDIRSLEALL
ncbi:MAG: nucleoside 2-deoxyribosyltransferase [Pseudonocardiaceae bacterium]